MLSSKHDTQVSASAQLIGSVSVIPVLALQTGAGLLGHVSLYESAVKNYSNNFKRPTARLHTSPAKVNFNVEPWFKVLTLMS